MSAPEFTKTGTDLTVHVPLTFRTHGGRKLVIAPENETWSPPKLNVDKILIKALGRAWRWKGLLESGTYATTEDLADAEKINPSYLARILRLTLLAPSIVEAILDGRQPASLQLEDLLKPFSVEWDEQRKLFRFIT